MKITPAYFSIIGAFLLLGLSPQITQADSASLGKLQVMILDDSGAFVHGAHIYIFSADKKQFLGTREAQGTTSFDLPEGSYRISAAMVQKNNGIFDHYASPEAVVNVTTDEPTSVILPLQEAEDNQMILSDTARQKLGIDPSLADNLN